MITTDFPINKTEGKDFMPFDLRLSNQEPATQDKRSEPRVHKVFQLKCKTYNIESDTFEISDAIVHNYGANGLYFEATNPFHLHDPICLSLKDQLLEKSDSEFAKGVHAQIVWCKPLNTGSVPRYGVGVKYFETIELNVGSL